ncbi:helix-turn-helix transcriptional regulator [Staphylococcus hyicus]|uniref:helix-turn-helix transcriptional regulator n=1 Tax=Staphylococcus hyicus TaxID=1284 RepID=UPI00211BBC18|nr:helix-turn-helix transcriptional regulator [Staphylococcus hyicus]MCQ9290657.1 helix-turn-helix transcriptional regulator [Staphylococcus hyicus]MCQ9305899.1 helix-turn-helix transcriptional regulator [Staphylococcus hyicus]MCQ9308311.1 helix-turn-helix transcriptional regulator [Staphylococcus hyicus]MCQ9310733.1 helix-turn-helix transcriptional regulator [Staphylococcus hyicus]
MKKEKNYILRNERDRQGYSQKDMAKVLNVDYMTYGNKENGKYQFTEFEMLKICKLLNKSLDDLFMREVV